MDVEAPIPPVGEQIEFLLEHPAWLRDGQRLLVEKARTALATGHEPGAHAVAFIRTWFLHHTARKAGFQKAP